MCARSAGRHAGRVLIQARGTDAGKTAITGSAGVEDIEMRIAVVSVDGRLHRIAHVVDAAVSVDLARERMRVGGRVAVEHPHQPPFRRYHHVGIVIPREIRRERLQPFAHAPVDHHPAVVRQITGQDDVRIAEVRAPRRRA